MTTETPTTLELSAYDFYTVIDASGSMGKGIKHGGRSMTRLEAVRETAEQHARVADSIDTDGGSVGFFNNEFHLEHNVTADKMEAVFATHKPAGGTATDRAIRGAWEHHKKNSTKKFLLTVFTDGEPDSQSAVETVICDIANHISDKTQARIQFIQVGDDPGASAWLEKLDSGLKGRAKFDIVNFQTLDWVEKNGSEAALVQAALDE